MENGSQGRGNSRGAHQDPESMSRQEGRGADRSGGLRQVDDDRVTGVTLAIYLAALGLTAVAVGVLVGAGLAGRATATLAQSVCADRIGRRRTLIALAILTSLGFVAMALTRTSSLMTLAPIAFFGMLNGMGARPRRCRRAGSGDPSRYDERGAAHVDAGVVQPRARRRSRARGARRRGAGRVVTPARHVGARGAP
jgi:hypothetical protein